MEKLGLLEFFLIEFALYMVLWLSYDYLSALLSTIFGIISLLLLIVAWIAEGLEPSRIPAWYFKLMLASVIAPLAAGGVYLFIMGGQLNF